MKETLEAQALVLLRALRGSRFLVREVTTARKDCPVARCPLLC
jgi:hypothetical protein